jgi:hypothetical protein
MNGTAEQWAQSAALAAQRSEQKAEASRHISEKMYGLFESASREISEVRREVRKLTEIVGAMTTAPAQHRKASKSQFNPTDTGSHFLVPTEQLDDLLEQRKQREDATSYRRLWRRVRGLVIAIASGAAAIGGEQLVKFLIGH